MVILLLTRLLTNFSLPQVSDMLNFIQFMEACLSSVVFIGATILFLLSCERRLKRMKALQGFEDQVVLDAVDEIESLSAGLSRKI